MPLGGNRVFLEETCLVAKPALPFAVLKRRLERRLAAMNVKVKQVCISHKYHKFFLLHYTCMCYVAVYVFYILQLYKWKLTFDRLCMVCVKYVNTTYIINWKILHTSQIVCVKHIVCMYTVCIHTDTRGRMVLHTRWRPSTIKQPTSDSIRSSSKPRAPRHRFQRQQVSQTSTWVCCCCCCCTQQQQQQRAGSLERSLGHSVVTRATTTGMTSHNITFNIL